MKKTLLGALLVTLFTGGFALSCKDKHEEIAPLPPPPAPTPPPPPVVIAPEEDAGVDAADADADAKKLTGNAAPADVAGLRACCNALAQNAQSMPPPNNAFAMQAAAMCQGAVAAVASGSQTKAGALGMIGGMLRGAGLPPACR